MFDYGEYVIPVAGHPKIYMVLDYHTKDVPEMIDYRGNRRSKKKGHVDLLDMEFNVLYPNVRAEGIKHCPKPE